MAQLPLEKKSSFLFVFLSLSWPLTCPACQLDMAYLSRLYPISTNVPTARYMRTSIGDFPLRILSLSRRTSPMTFSYRCKSHGAFPIDIQRPMSYYPCCASSLFIWYFFSFWNQSVLVFGVLLWGDWVNVPIRWARASRSLLCWWGKPPVVTVPQCTQGSIGNPHSRTILI